MTDGLCVFQELVHGWILIGSPSLSLLPKKVFQRVLTYLAAEERCHPRYGESTKDRTAGMYKVINAHHNH